LRTTPVVSLLAVASLALGIGANTAIFSILNAILLRPLPVRDPQQLVMVTSSDDDTSMWPLAVWSRIRDRRLLPGGFAWFWNRFDTARGGERQFVDGIAVSGELFESLGVRPALGRLLMSADDEPVGGPDGPVAVISHRFWQRRFDGAPDVLGRSIVIERRPFTIVGVTSPEFRGLDIGLPFDVAIPLAAEAQIRSASQFGEPWVTMMGRLNPGQTAEIVTAALRAAQPEIREATNPYTVSPYRDEYLRDPFSVRAASGGASVLRHRYERPFEILLAVVGLVLLVACGNIGTLLVARTLGRRHELAVRAALGASRARLARQLLVESALLAATGVAAGALFARWCSSLVVERLSSQAFTMSLDVSPDWRVLGFTAVVGAATALLFGIAPALRAAGADPLDALKAPSPIGGGRFGFGDATVVAQLTVALVLCVLTGLFVQTFLALNSKDVGFERDRVLVVTLDASRSAVPPDERGALYDRVSESITSASGVEAAGLSAAMPGGTSAWTPWIELADGTPLPQGPNGIYGNRITAGWFRTLGTRLLEGREFDARDRAGAPKVALVNEEFVRRFLKGQRPVGQTIVHRSRPEAPGQPYRIVGLVEDAMYRFIKEEPPPTVYTPLMQMTDPLPATVYVSVRARGGSPAALSRAVAEAIGRVDHDVSLTFRRLTDQVNAQYAQERLVAAVSTFFGTLALILAALGLYGVTSYAVTRQRSEIGIRMALGAEPRHVVSMVLGRVARLIVLGLCAGIVMSLGAVRLLGSMLYGLQQRDPATLATAGGVLIIASALAAWLPARRAARMDPASVLREA
ncbi:MAG TPA: ABC transporter permease, partial [Gemmatimonadales bacterium]|nr:ABC transporter permease [Gemmatimonadales bacterium]